MSNFEMTICFENCDTLKLHSRDIKWYGLTKFGFAILLKKSADAVFYHFGERNWASTVFKRLCQGDITAIHIKTECGDAEITVPYEPDSDELGAPNKLQFFKIDECGELAINISLDGGAHFAEMEDLCGNTL